MRILYIFRSLAVLGGIERVLVDKMNFLATQGYEVHLLTTCQGSHPIPFDLEKSVHIEDLGIQFHLQYQYNGLRRLWEDFCRTKWFERRLVERLKVIQPDVIICTTTDPVYSIMKVKGKIPLVVEAHNICYRALGEKGPHQRMIAWRLKRGLKKVACLVALTDQDAEEWRKLKIPVKVIPNVVHLNKDRTSNLESRRVVWVGRFDYQKRPLEIVKIWKLVHPNFSDWHLDIYGEGELGSELNKVVESLNMNIHVHPPTKDIFNVYRNSSILVSTSLFEPFGLVIPEAMSCGMPVIAYDSPYGPSSIISNGKDGFVVENGNRILFAERIMQLIKDKPLRQEMGSSALKASLCCSAHVIMPKWCGLFEQIQGLPPNDELVLI